MDFFLQDSYMRACDIKDLWELAGSEMYFRHHVDQLFCGVGGEHLQLISVFMPGSWISVGKM